MHHPYYPLLQVKKGRGYGYVAVSRFESRAGCYLYGNMRRTDFLPVGDEREEEVLERSIASASSSDDDWRGHHFPRDSSNSSEEIDAPRVGIVLPNDFELD